MRLSYLNGCPRESRGVANGTADRAKDGRREKNSKKCHECQSGELTKKKKDDGKGGGGGG